jgi:heavy metal sensor kinase
MIRSLRWRLQLWHTGLLLTVVSGFGGILYYQARTGKLQEIDAQLETAILYLDVSLRNFPPFELEGTDPPPRDMAKDKPEPNGKDPAWPKDKKGPKKFQGAPPFGRGPPFPPPKRSRERLLADLALPREAEVPAGTPKIAQPYFAVWRADGSLLKATDLPEGVGPATVQEESLFFRPIICQRGDFREAWMRGPHNSLIVVGKQITQEAAELRRFGWQLIGIAAIVLLIGMAGGYWLGLRIVRPIAAMSETASSISATNLSARIDATEVDVELSELAEVLNALFARMEAAFERQRQFTADASHELRTPLAILRANAELALSQARSPEEYRHTLESCLRAANRMATLVQALLTLARHEDRAGNRSRKSVSDGFPLVPLEQVLIDCVTLLQPLAKGKDVKLTAELSPVVVRGDLESLTQLVNNLITNAIQHNVPGGTVHVRLMLSSGEAVLSVADTGPGIPEKDRHRVFERFFRADKARSRASGGTGLGLAICKAVVESHGGVLDFESRVNEGTTFRVALPAVV